MVTTAQAAVAPLVTATRAAVRGARTDPVRPRTQHTNERCIRNEEIRPRRDRGHGGVPRTCGMWKFWVEWGRRRDHPHRGHRRHHRRVRHRPDRPCSTVRRWRSMRSTRAAACSARSSSSSRTTTARTRPSRRSCSTSSSAKVRSRSSARPTPGRQRSRSSSQKKLPIIGAVDDGGLTVYTQGPDKPPAPYAFGTSLNTFAWGGAIGRLRAQHCQASRRSARPDARTALAASRYPAGVRQGRQEARAHGLDHRELVDRCDRRP